ncbi:MAG: bifunctional sugar-1-phosphate nucleotidylyltransferase/acetyltransferase [Methanomicrobiales archaeon]
MKAVILTAGEGTRMRPLTLSRPKTMLTVGGKPILQYNVEALQNAGIEEIIMVVGYEKECIMDYFGDGTSFGLKIHYVVQDERLGTAHAIGKSRDNMDKPFIVLNGDIMVDPQLIVSLIDKYNSKQYAKAVLVLTRVEDPSLYGVVEINDDEIKNIVEKPSRDEAPSNLINTGIYLFDTDIFDVIDKTGKSERGEYEITDSIAYHLDKGKIVLGLESERKWIDIGRPWELLDVNEELLKNIDGKIEGRIEKGVTIEGIVNIGKDSILRSGSYIQGPVFIGKGCDIGPNCYLRKYSSVGNNVRIGNAVEIKNSIIMDNTNVNHLSYVGDSVIGENCNIAAGTNIANLRFDDGNVKIEIKGEKVDSGRRKMGVIFADGVKTGINSSFNPGVKVGEKSAISAGAIIHKDVPSNVLVLVKQNHELVKINDYKKK